MSFKEILLVVFITAAAVAAFVFLQLPIAAVIIFAYIFLAIALGWDAKIGFVAGITLLLANSLFVLAERPELVNKDFKLYGLILFGYAIVDCIYRVVLFGVRRTLGWWRGYLELRKNKKNISYKIVRPIKREKIKITLLRLVGLSKIFFKEFLNPKKAYLFGIFVKKTIVSMVKAVVSLLAGLFRWMTKLFLTIASWILKTRIIDWLKVLTILVAIFLLLTVLKWQLFNIVLALLMIIWLLYVLNPSYLAFLALALLFVANVYLILGKNDAAELLSIYSYYLLAFSVFNFIYWQAVSGRRELKR